MAELKIKRRVLSACQTNCYYVYREGADEVIVIDPGDRGDVVYEDVKQLGFEKVAGILLTHGHGDHTGGAIELKSRSGAKIYAFEEEREILMDPEKNLSGWFGKAYGFEADEYLHHRQTLVMAGVTFEVLHTPGHTKGGCCFYDAEDAVMFCGDTIFNCSVGRTDFYSGSMKQLSDSIREQIMTLPDETKLYSGHGEKTTVGYERKYNPCLS
ncbi:MAG: MBL fold metallo-hydrolase [Lachnospiraceae bacterium]|nr:MBL fold metallo-hydrolase [Lachnospiraceae bacterium]MBQ2115142.1 MBL fold metallo-hydrolase [Lachnospiraceae bacterium]MBQ5850187.1 MBL fold metallo-hydrolase [Lachnospiraceae bacterium]